MPSAGSISGYTLRSDTPEGTVHNSKGTVDRQGNKVKTFKNATSASDINNLNILGKEYQIKTPNMEAYGKDSKFYGLAHGLEGNNEKLVISGLSYSNAGIMKVSKQGDIPASTTYFHQGITPNELPTGQAHYEGNSYLFSYGPSYGDRTLYDTKAGAHFDVDFNAKTINGRLDNKIDLGFLNKQDIRDGFNFTGTIKGNKFTADQDKIFYSGGFYGPQAQELSGFMAHEDDHVWGVFDGKK